MRARGYEECDDAWKHDNHECRDLSSLISSPELRRPGAGHGFLASAAE